LVIGLLGVGFLFLLMAAGAGYYFFLRRPPAPPTSTTLAQMEPPSTTAPVTEPSEAPSAPPTSMISGVPATEPASRREPPPATAPPATAPPATAPPATQGTAPATTPAAGSPDYAYLDEEAPAVDGREAGERVAGTYRRGESSGYGASGRYEQRERSPRNVAMPERPAIASLRHVMNAEEEFHRKNNRYASFAELVSSRILALDVPVQQKEFLRKNYRFELTVESDGFTVVARPLTPGLRPFVGDDSGYIRSGTE
jgi:hypothetical protein